MAKIPEHYDADLITDASELENLCDRLADEGLAIGYDVETSYEGEPRADAAKHPEENFICGFSFTNSLSWARAVPVAFESGPNLDSGRAAKAVRHLADARDKQGRPLLVPHNGVFELRCTARWFAYELGMTLEEAYWPLRSDTMVEAYIEAAHESYALKTLTWETFGIEQPSIMTLFESPGAKKLTKFQEDSIQFHLLDPTDPKVITYMCDDAHRTLGHHLLRYPKVTDPAFRGAFCYKVDMGLLPVLCAMSDVGIAYDWTMMAEAAQRGQAFLARLGAEINAMLSADLGRPVALNLASPLQIQKVLYDKADGLGLPVRRRSKKTNNPSTDKNAMKALADVHPVIRKIQSYRGIKRRVTDNYAGKYEQDYNYAPDGRAHPNILYTAVVTGRRAYSRPAAQQPPKTKTWQLGSGETFTFPWRDFITVPPPGALGDTERKGWYILGFDLSQAELRGMAGEAQEPALLEAYERGEDVHRLTASKMLGVPFGEVTDEQRSIGKAQPMTEPVLTPAGWRRMGDLQPGDQVIGGAGQPVKVTGVFPQGRKLVYRVITSDGASAECCAEHLWTARNRHTRSKVWKTRSLGAMLEKGLFGSARVVNGREYRKAKYELPERPVVQYSPPRRPPFSPYVMGLLLGDGGFTQRLQFCSADQDLLDAVRAEHEALGGRVTDEIDNGPGCRKIYLRAGQPYDRNGNLIKTVLEIQGLMGLRDHQKFIPDAFLLASPEDRLALLQGLLDTDGNALDSGAEFRVTSERLALGVQELARSLGGWASIKELDRVRTPYHVKSDPLPIWRVYLRLPAEVCPFRLERKRRSWKPARYRVNQCIFDVQAAGAKDCVCISVDSPDGLYVTSNYLVTHNTCNLALQYQMSAPSLAESLGVPKEDGQRLYDAWFATYPRVKAWTEATVAAAVRDGYTTSRYGRKHPIWEFAKTCPACAKRGVTSKWTHAAPRCPRCNFLGIPKSEAVIAKGMRLAGNAPIQGCLPADTRVLTWRGWIPIGEFEDGESVWTGAEWAPAERLYKGDAPRLRLHLSDGRTFDCDNRHKLLVTDGGPWPQWCPVTDIKGRVLARDEAQDWGLPDGRSVEDWYWIGRFTGDGCLWQRKGGHVMWKMAFDRTKEAEDIERFCRWVASKQWNTAHSPTGYSQHGRAEGWSVLGQTVPARDWWLAVGGFRTGKGGVQEVPPEVFTLDRKRREAFLQGRADADGYRRGYRADHGRELRDCTKIGTVSLTAAQDLLRLATTLGMSGRVCGPYVMHHRGAGGQEYSIYEFYLHRQPMPLRVDAVEELGVIEPMFTLSVMHDRHAFSSEGLISKNSATGDYMRIAMIRVDQALRKAGLREAVHPFLDVHDSLDFYVRRDLDPGEVIAVLQPAAVFEVPGWPEVVLDWHMGLRMGSLKELEIGPGLSWAVKGTKAEAAVPSEDDEDDEGPAPVAADLSAIKVPAALPGSDSDGDGGSQPEARSSGAGPRQRATADPGALAGSNPASPRPFAATSAGDGQPRTVIVTLPGMPAAENARRLRAALGNLPGPNTVLLRTPAGDVQVPGTSGLAPEHAADVAFILPGASVAYDAASVDYAAIAEGIAV